VILHDVAEEVAGSRLPAVGRHRIGPASSWISTA
jgi:hypothetical protein